MKYPIKVLMDKDKKPFIPFVPTSAIVENGTGRTLEEILANLAVPIVNLTSLDNETVAAMMTKMYNYKDIGFSIIYAETNVEGILFTYSSQATADVLNKTWTFISGFDKDGNAYNLHITGYYNAETKAFTVSNIDLVNGISNEVGNLESLVTENKTSVVDAINEVYDRTTGYFLNINKAEELNTEENLKLINEWYQYYAKYKILKPIYIRTRHWQTSYYYHTFILSSFSERAPLDYIIDLTFSSRNADKTNSYYITGFSLTLDDTRTNVKSIGYGSSGGYLNVMVQTFPDMSQYLSKTNTTLYTPTKDYHPATKKYVDDAIKTVDLSDYATTAYVDEQLGDINTILATVTTPEVNS